MKFDSDEKKARDNKRKHDVSFAEAEEVFDDFNSVEFFDETHSETETRFKRVGLSGKRLLFVIYTVREENGEEIVRLISARKATSMEVQIYNEFNR